MTRCQLVLYPTLAPAWIRLERHPSPGRVTCRPLKFSLRADEILPADLIEFRP